MTAIEYTDRDRADSALRDAEQEIERASARDSVEPLALAQLDTQLATGYALLAIRDQLERLADAAEDPPVFGDLQELAACAGHAASELQALRRLAARSWWRRLGWS